MALTILPCRVRWSRAEGAPRPRRQTLPSRGVQSHEFLGVECQDPQPRRPCRMQLLVGERDAPRLLIGVEKELGLLDRRRGRRLATDRELRRCRAGNRRFGSRRCTVPVVHDVRTTSMPPDVLQLPIHMSHHVSGVKVEEDAPGACRNVIQPAWLRICVEIVVTFVRPGPRTGARVIPLHPRRRWTEANVHRERRTSIDQLPQQPGKLLRCVRIACELDPTRHVFLSSCGLSIADRRGTGKRPWAREAASPEMALHRNASTDPRCVGPDLDNDLPIVGQSQADDDREVPTDEEDFRGSRAKPLFAPATQTLLIDRGSLQRASLRGRVSWARCPRTDRSRAAQRGRARSRAGSTHQRTA